MPSNYTDYYFMNLHLLSDAHLEFGPILEPVGGDVLVLAGDILTAEGLSDPLMGDRYLTFLQQCSERYNKVFYVMGNHEHYHHRFDRTADVIRDVLPSNFTLLDNSSEYYEGVHFIGATLWADFKGGDNLTMQQAGDCMTDYHVIDLNDGARLIPMDTLLEHDNSVEWLRQVLPTLRGKKVIISHHAPSQRSLSGRYNCQLGGAYASDLDKLVADSGATYWLHGHIHVSNDYKVGECRVVSNPHGYHPDGLNCDYRPELNLSL